jgi:hypothetical protein
VIGAGMREPWAATLIIVGVPVVLSLLMALAKANGQ